jgi:glycoprotein endo-alpha-1,2-mannosidase
LSARIKWTFLPILFCLCITLCVPHEAEALNYKIHAQYYLWYGNPVFNGSWVHWGGSGFFPPDNIASPFYPLLADYSSKDPAVIHQHMKWLVDAGVGTVCFDWWGPGHYTDEPVPLVMDIAHQYGIKCLFMIDQRTEQRSGSRTH